MNKHPDMEITYERAVAIEKTLIELYEDQYGVKFEYVINPKENDCC